MIRNSSLRLAEGRLDHDLNKATVSPSLKMLIVRLCHGLSGYEDRTM